jgi:hypothetical protein
MLHAHAEHLVDDFLIPLRPVAPYLQHIQPPIMVESMEVHHRVVIVTINARFHPRQVNRDMQVEHGVYLVQLERGIHTMSLSLSTRDAEVGMGFNRYWGYRTAGPKFGSSSMFLNASSDSRAGHNSFPLG